MTEMGILMLELFRKMRQYRARMENLTKTMTPVYVNSAVKRPIETSWTTLGPNVWMCFPKPRGIPDDPDLSVYLRWT